MKSITLLLLPILSGTLIAADPEVKLAAVQVVIDDGAKEFDGFKTFNSDTGYNVALIVRAADKQMVGFDDDKATITIGGAKTNCRFFGKQAFSEDHLALRIEFNTDGKATVSPDGSLAVKGELPITLASGKAETRSEPFAVEKGAEVKFPADAKDMPTLKVKSTGKPKWGDNKLEIEFTTNRRVDDFAGIRFLDKDGKEIESDRGGSSWMSMMGKGSGTFSYTFKTEPKELILVIDNWTGKEEKKLAVDLKAGLAMP